MNPLSDWQRAAIIDRVADGFSNLAKQNLNGLLRDQDLLELWDASFPGEALPQPDAARYAQLVARLNVLRAAKLNARELWEVSARLQQEIEVVKNHIEGHSSSELAAHGIATTGFVPRQEAA